MSDFTHTVYPTPFNGIPDEQLEHIFSDAIARSADGLSVILTCKRWYRVGIPFVFRSVYLLPYNIEKFLASLEASLPPGYGTYVKDVFCVAGPPSGAILGANDLARLFKLCPNIEELFLARFWHQNFHNALSQFPTLTRVKKLTWLHAHSPPIPTPNTWIGQFGAWPALESLKLRMLSLTEDEPGTTSTNQPALSAIDPDPRSKLRELVLLGNFIRPISLTSGLTALRAPLEVLEINSVGLLGPAGIVQGLQLVGGQLYELRIIDDGRIGALGRVETVLLPRMKELCPLLRRLHLQGVPFPRHCFEYLPEGLKKLVVLKPGPLGALELLETLREARGWLRQLEELQWSAGAAEDGWQIEEVNTLLNWGRSEPVRISVPIWNEEE